MHSYKIEGLKGNLKDQSHVYIRQKPNRKFLGFFKVYLSIHNTFDGKSKLAKRMREGLGEPPVIYDSTISKFSASQIQQFLFNKGYFNAEVRYSDTIKHQKAYVHYKAVLKEPYTIRNIHYNIKDSAVRSIYFMGLNRSKLAMDANYDQDVIQEERERIANSLKNQGYYYFNREYIHFDIDSALNSNQVDVYLVIENRPGDLPHQYYHIKNVELKVEPSEGYKRSASAVEDTTYIEGIRIIDPERKFKARTLERMNFIDSASLYAQQNVDLTYTRLGDLGVFKFVDISFAPSSTDSNKLDALISLSPSSKRSTQFELEGYVASENLGSSINFLHTNRNIFKGGETFEFRIRGGLETQAFIDERQSRLPVFNSREANASATLTFPEFLFLSENLSDGRYGNPRTRIGINYTFESRPEYLRRTVNGIFSYEWKRNNFITHLVSPVDISFVRSVLSQEAIDAFENLNNQFLKASFDPHVSLGAEYSLTINTQILNLVRDYYYFRFNIEVTGTGSYLISQALGADKDINGNYRILNLPFYSFTRPEIDIRYFNYVNRKNLVAYRFNTGIGFTYWNSRVLPFERQFFTGGSNSIRAFKARSVGPGTFSGDNQTGLNLDQTGDIKLEGNVEYRFDIFDRFFGSKLKGASFLDMGNVWTMKNQSSIPGAQFKWNSFLKELAVGTGVGLRMDYSFLLLRFDLGIKLRDPQFASSERWVISKFGNSQWKNDHRYSFLNFNLGIGYPF